LVSKLQIAFESKAQADEKAQHTWKYVSILKRFATQLSDDRWGFETNSRRTEQIMSRMKSLHLKMAIFFVVFFFSFGCTLNSAPKTTPSYGQTLIRQSNNAYYYFTEAQIQRDAGNLEKAIVLLNQAIQMDPASVYLKRELATVYLQNKEDENAIKVLEDLLKAHPDDVKALILYGGIRQVQKENEAAIKAYEKVIALDPQQEKVYSLLGGIYLDAGNLEQAKRVFTQLLDHIPESYAGHFFLGKIYAEEGQPQAAEKEFQRTLELKPELLEPRFELLKLYNAQDNQDKIIQIYHDILERDPGNIQATMELGYYDYSHGKTAEAEEIFKKLGQRSKTEFEVIIKVIQLYIDKKKYDEGLVVIQGMLQAVPDSSELHHIAGIAFYGKKDNQSALAHFRKVAPDSRFYEDAVIHAAYLLSEDKKNDEAIKLLSDASQKSPKNAEFNYYLGTFYEEEEQFEKAEIAIKKAIQLDPNNPKYYFRLGVVYDKLNRKEASMEAMRKVIAIDPKHSNALNYLGYTYADLGQNLDEAEQLIKEALKYKPDDGYITDSLGWVYYKKGDFEKALKYLQKAVEIVPDDPIMLEHLGDAYLKLNDKVNALKSYKKSLQHKEKDKEELETKIRAITKNGS
jgi:tetratricopeptide (TPR) repeat protein